MHLINVAKRLEQNICKKAFRLATCLYRSSYWAMRCTDQHRSRCNQMACSSFTRMEIFVITQRPDWFMRPFHNFECVYLPSKRHGNQLWASNRCDFKRRSSMSQPFLMKRKSPHFCFLLQFFFVFALAFCGCYSRTIINRSLCIFYAAHSNNWHTHKSHFELRIIESLLACQMQNNVFYTENCEQFSMILFLLHSEPCVALFTAIWFTRYETSTNTNTSA